MLWLFLWFQLCGRAGKLTVEICKANWFFNDRKMGRRWHFWQGRMESTDQVDPCIGIVFGNNRRYIPANAVRQILAAEGVPPGHIFMVAGRADTDPLFPDNPSLAPNRRVTITLIREEPPIPADLRP